MRASTAPSKSCRLRWQPIPIAGIGSSAKRAPLPR